VAWAVVGGLFYFYSIYSSFFLLLGYSCIGVFEDVRNIQMVSAAVYQISISDEYVTNSPRYIQTGTRSSEYAGVQLFNPTLSLYVAQYAFLNKSIESSI
jgi:hypothetical protein